jgi:lipopolysaccharide transport system permease protein
MKIDYVSTRRAPAPLSPLELGGVDERLQESMTEARAEDVPLTIIEPSSGWRAVDLRELWSYRELLYFLIWRDVKVRYKQTALGALWAVIQPFVTMVVFSIFFGRLAGVPSDGVPYPIFSFAALVPWTFFAHGLHLGGESLTSNQGLLRKVYFPRLALPIAAVLTGLVDFGIAFVVLLALMLYYGFIVTLTATAVLPLMVLVIATVLGVSLWLSALNVQYRDVRHVLPFLTQVWLFVTPIAYPSSLLSEPWRTVYSLNPMAGVVEGFRWALLGTGAIPIGPLAVSCASAALLLVTGAFYFRRMERTFADLV